MKQYIYILTKHDDQTNWSNIIGTYDSPELACDALNEYLHLLAREAIKEVIDDLSKDIKDECYLGDTYVSPSIQSTDNYSISEYELNKIDPE